VGLPARHRHATGSRKPPTAQRRWCSKTGYHPALLKDAVTTPRGCTIDGILELEEAACA